MKRAISPDVRAGVRLGLLAVSLAGAPILSAQAGRDSLIARAKDEFDGKKRIQLLISALDPARGPVGGGWGDGVQALAQALLDDGQAPAATTWLRWAARLSPGLQPDTIQYTPQVGAALRAAREFASRTRSAGDSLVVTTWRWPSGSNDNAVAWFQVDSTGPVALEVAVEGSTPVGLGGRVQLAPGSYEVRATAPGHDTVRMTREALPGATTLLRIRLQPVRTPVAAANQTPNRPATTVPTVKKHKFPWVLAALGAAGVGTAVVLLGGGKSSGSSGGGGSGGITFFFPNP
jgi:hypothetical protein